MNGKAAKKKEKAFKVSVQHFASFKSLEYVICLTTLKIAKIYIDKV